MEKKDCGCIQISGGGIVMAVLGIAVGGAALGGILGSAVSWMTASMGMTLGWSLGAFVGSWLFGSDAGESVVEGPRLADLKVQAGSYGVAIPKVYGSARLAGNVIWSAGIVEHRHEEEYGAGCGGGGGGTQVTYTYTCSFAVGICEGEIDSVLRIWADGNLVWGSGDLEEEVESTIDLTIYTGSETQTPSSVIEATEGSGDAPAYRGLAYVVFEDLQLGDYGNRIPNLEFEVVTNTTLLDATMDLSTSLCHYDHSGTYVGKCRVCDHYDGRFYIASEAECDWSGCDEWWVSYLDSYTGECEQSFQMPCSTKLICYLNGTLLVGAYKGGWGGTTYKIFTAPEENPTDISEYPWLTRELHAGTTPQGYICAACRIRERPLRYALAIGYEDDGQIFFLNQLSGPYNDTKGYNDPPAEGFNFKPPWLKDSGGLGTNRWTIIGMTMLDGDLVVLMNWLGYFKMQRFDPYNGELLESLPTGTDVVYTGDISSWCDLATVGEHLVMSDITAGVERVMFKDGFSFDTIQYPARSADVTTLDAIVADLLEEGGVSSGDYDVTALSGINVRGYIRPRQMTVRAALEPLMAAFCFDLIEVDYTLTAVLRSAGSSEATIDEDDLAAKPVDTPDVDRNVTVIQQELEIPRRINIKYYDEDSSYQVNVTTSLWVGANSSKVSEIELPIIMSADQARQAAEIIHAQLWQSRTTYEFRTTNKYLKLIPGDQINIAMTYAGA